MESTGGQKKQLKHHQGRVRKLSNQSFSGLRIFTVIKVKTREMLPGKCSLSVNGVKPGMCYYR